MCLIKIRDVSKDFVTCNNLVHAVKNITLDINQKDIFGIIGYSGAGKSTFIRLINGLEKITSGKILIDDKNISELKNKNLRDLKKDIGMIFQHFNLLWSRTVFKNIELALELAGIDKITRQERVDELLDLVGLVSHKNFYPAQLSGGQKQRVGIARAIANHPKILLCDEATSSLDPKTTNEILNLIVKINRELDLTIILITHEMHVVKKICNRVAVLDSGKIISIGDSNSIKFFDQEQAK